MVVRNTYKYRFKVGGKVVHCGITSDLARREREHRRRWPTGHHPEGEARDHDRTGDCG